MATAQDPIWNTTQPESWAPRDFLFTDALGDHYSNGPRRRENIGLLRAIEAAFKIVRGAQPPERFGPGDDDREHR